MDLRRAGALGGLVGGLAWLLRWVTSAVGVGAGVENAAYWLGAACLSAAALCVGAGLVSRRSGWLRVVSASCLLVLCWSVLLLVHRDDPRALFDAVVGATAVGVAGLVLRTRPRAALPRPVQPRAAHLATDRRRTAGAHAR